MKKTILIVDDNPKNIQVVANLLKDENYNINFAQSGQSVLTNIGKKPCDLILLDIMMPGMSGFEVCDILKKQDATKNIPIIFLTAKDDIDSMTTGFELGGVDYITKPFNAKELLVRIKTQLTLQDQKNELQELNVMKDKFYSIIAHDLRNPFNTLIGLLDLIKGNFDEMSRGQIKEFVEIAFTSSMKGYALLENLLDWTRSQLGKIQFEPQYINLKEILTDIAENFTSSFEKKQLTLYYGIESDLMLSADENMFRTIFRNLISNAIKYTPEKGEITLSAKMNDDHLTISVADTGVGMSEEDMEKLFRMDENHSTLGTNNEKGTGFGLLLCKEFIHKHGWELEVESKINDGSKFNVKIFHID